MKHLLYLSLLVFFTCAQAVDNETAFPPSLPLGLTLKLVTSFTVTYTSGPKTTWTATDDTYISATGYMARWDSTSSSFTFASTFTQPWRANRRVASVTAKDSTSLCLQITNTSAADASCSAIAYGQASTMAAVASMRNRLGPLTFDQCTWAYTAGVAYGTGTADKYFGWPCSDSAQVPDGFTNISYTLWYETNGDKLLAGSGSASHTPTASVKSVHWTMTVAAWRAGEPSPIMWYPDRPCMPPKLPSPLHASVISRAGNDLVGISTNFTDQIWISGSSTALPMRWDEHFSGLEMMVQYPRSISLVARSTGYVYYYNTSEPLDPETDPFIQMCSVEPPPSAYTYAAGLRIRIGQISFTSCSSWSYTHGFVLDGTAVDRYVGTGCQFPQATSVTFTLYYQYNNDRLIKMVGSGSSSGITLQLAMNVVTWDVKEPSPKVFTPNKNCTIVDATVSSSSTAVFSFVLLLLAAFFAL